MKSPETEPARIVVRKATPDDAERLCEIRDQAWLEAYPNEELGITKEMVLLNAQGEGGDFLPRRINYWRDKTSTESGPSVYVAEVNGEVAGYVEPVIEEGRSLISAIYVAPKAQRLGVGSELLQKAISILDRENDIYLEVVSYNKKAISFYTKHGFVQTGNTVVDDEAKPSYMTTLPQIEMVLLALKTFEK